ncbi:hypothetical protein cce_0700 [Crocosphaera subtropica ATCC 51142]|uniref:Uncharacterized protein n=1 Tax=Crocosphaera subtropica (strain ATCC 51142 / BH68) TaxID=43989 RepID=B1WQC9_CROS5|nr:hypothetical protein [Crocosphaera subtropica]ACB50051.1 hypothetical protein cce_0700 [Crocosphaera subtropica ATCC 51142]
MSGKMISIPILVFKNNGERELGKNNDMTTNLEKSIRIIKDKLNHPSFLNQLKNYQELKERKLLISSNLINSQQAWGVGLLFQELQNQIVLLEVMRESDILEQINLVINDDKFDKFKETDQNNIQAWLLSIVDSFQEKLWKYLVKVFV